MRGEIVKKERREWEREEMFVYSQLFSPLLAPGRAMGRKEERVRGNVVKEKRRKGR